MALQPCIISLLLLMLAIREGQVLGQQVQYMGCFDNQYAQQEDMHTVITDVNFSQCALYCTRKGMPQMGIEKSEDLCYCGDDIAEASVQRVGDNMCNVPCGDYNNRTCGGVWLMSVYKFSTTTTTTTTNLPTSADLAATNTGNGQTAGFLVGVANGTRMYKASTPTTFDTLMSSPKYVFGVDYHYAKGLAYHYSEGRLYRSSLYVQTSGTVLSEEIKMVGRCPGFAIDWVQNKIYFAQCLPGIKIVSMSLDGSNATDLLSQRTAIVKLMEIDPYRKKLFWTADSVIESCDLSGNNYKTNMSETGVTVRALSIDLEARRVFYIGTSALYSMDYQGGDKIFHYSTQRMSSVYGMGVHKDLVFWVNFAIARDIIYKGHKNEPERYNIQEVTAIDRGVWHMKFIHPDLQRMPKNLCPDGFEFLQDKNGCSEMMPATTSISVELRPTVVVSTRAELLTTQEESSDKPMDNKTHVLSDLNKGALQNKEAQDSTSTTSSSTTVILWSLLVLAVGITLFVSLAYFGDKYWTSLRGKGYKVSYKRDNEEETDNSKYHGVTDDNVRLIHKP